MLQWEGVAGTKARWHRRWLHVWRGRVYLSRHRDDGEALLVKWVGGLEGVCSDGTCAVAVKLPTVYAYCPTAALASP